MVVRGFRSVGYFFLDFLKGSAIRKNIKDIECIMDGKKDNQTQLASILDYVIQNVPYYKNIKGNNINNFPVINKQTIKSNYDSLQSQEYTEKEDLHWVTTSGSTGEPFKANQNIEKRKRTIADLIYFHQENNWNLGDKYVYLRAWTSIYSFSKLKLFLQNYIPVDIVNFSDDKKEILRTQLKSDKGIKVVLGYSSAMESFVQYLERMGDDKTMFNIKVIFTVSDNLTDAAKSKLENMFGCPVINRYSNEEMGVLAYTEAYSNTFRLNTASYYFELLQLDKDEPVEPGELGRIVITDLFNKSMPFIRYDTGDLAISDDSDNIISLSSFQGRISDVVLDARGNIITAPIVNNYFAEHYNTKKYQLVQTDTLTYQLNVVSINDEFDAEEYIDICKRFLGDKANITINKVEDISSGKNGKYKTIVNDMID